MTTFPEDDDMIRAGIAAFSTPARCHMRALEREQLMDNIVGTTVRFLRGMAEHPRESLDDALSVVDAFDRLTQSARRSLTLAAKIAAENAMRAPPLPEANVASSDANPPPRGPIPRPR